MRIAFKPTSTITVRTHLTLITLDMSMYNLGCRDHIDLTVFRRLSLYPSCQVAIKYLEIVQHLTGTACTVNVLLRQRITSMSTLVNLQVW